MNEREYHEESNESNIERSILCNNWPSCEITLYLAEGLKPYMTYSINNNK
jgi:hypothetical protein